MRKLVTTLLLSLAVGSALAKTWHVEKDGSGDFTVIQDALDAAASGDSVLVGPGRYEDFRERTTTVSGFRFLGVAHLTKSGIALLGSGAQSTTVGPEALVMEIGGLTTGGIYIDTGAEVEVRGFSIEKVQFPMTIRERSLTAECAITHTSTSTSWAVSIIEGDAVEITDCSFQGPQAIITGSAAVTNPKILRCRFSNPTLDEYAVVIGNGATDALVDECEIEGYAAGVQTSLGGTATIEDCRFNQVRIGAIDLSSGSITMRRCRIEAGGRFSLSAGQGQLEVYDSFIGGGTLTTIATWTSIYMRNCHLLNGGGLTVDSRGPAFEISDLRYNWWGTTDLQQIDSWITEFNPNVLYEPILTKPVSIARESLSSLKARFAQPAADHEP